MKARTTLTPEQAFTDLNESEKNTQLANGITVEDVYHLLQSEKRRELSRFVFNRFYRRYLLPFEKAGNEYKSGFAQMAACCLMIEAMESFRHGWNDTTKDALTPNAKKMNGGMILEEYFSRYIEFEKFRGLGKEFYRSIRCGILHQAEAMNGWTIMREGHLLDSQKRTINSTRFRRRMEKCLKNYCIELENADSNSEIYTGFKTKIAHIFQNCKTGPFLYEKPKESR